MDLGEDGGSSPDRGTLPCVAADSCSSRSSSSLLPELGGMLPMPSRRDPLRDACDGAAPAAHWTLDARSVS